MKNSNLARALALSSLFVPLAHGAEGEKPTSYSPVVITETMDAIMQRPQR